MSEQTVRCPRCGNEIHVTEAFAHQIEERMRAEYDRKAEVEATKYEQKLAQERAHLQAEAQKEATDSVAVQMQHLKRQLDQKSAQVDQTRKREVDLLNREKQVEEKEKDMNLKIQEQINQERKKIAAEVSQRVERQMKESFSLEIETLKSDLVRKSTALDDAQKREVTLLQQRRELEDRQKDLELEVQRKIAEERQQIWDQAAGKAAEENHLKIQEKEQQLTDARKQIDELKRKLEQGSQPLQGDVMQYELDDLLRSNFRFDDVELIKRGARGADVLHNVYETSQRHCGLILWESKNTKDWGEEWIEKLRIDQREANADIAVIVSRVLPKGAGRITYREGVWITDLADAIPLATALRIGLMQVAQARAALVGKKEKMDLLYEYLSGLQFKCRIEAMVESLAAMKTDLEAEKRTMPKRWARRDKQIQKAMESTASIYGDLEGIIGASLPEIKLLELPEAPKDLVVKKEIKVKALPSGRAYSVNEDGQEYVEGFLPFAEESGDDESNESYEDYHPFESDDDEVPF